MLRRIADWLRTITGDSKVAAPPPGMLLSNAPMPDYLKKACQAAKSQEEPERYSLENLPKGDLTLLSHEGGLYVGVEGYYMTWIFKISGDQDPQEVTDFSDKLKICSESRLLTEEELAQLTDAPASLHLATLSAQNRTPQQAHKPSLRFGDLPAGTVFFRHEFEPWAMTSDLKMYGAHDGGKLHEIASLDYKLKISLEGTVISMTEALKDSRQKGISWPVKNPIAQRHKEGRKQGGVT